MSRKRRHPKRRAVMPTGLDGITLCERTLWHVMGPLIKGDGHTLTKEGAAAYVVWDSWHQWATFYGKCRSELFAERPWRQASSVAEKLYSVVVAGGDPEAELDRIDAARAANDPRRGLLKQG